ncbi:MAG TPA: nucleotidyl transferase AbiEii/AbiGii toxin family protein [Nitrospiria bacterium]|nr:nucleotidyl transferase AbiEii/AbiGii toxin family protein [Nitrospiria bacterium]
MPAGYYDKVLYPIQNKVIGFFKDTPFYLTGGTALSRGYYNHRYSDDLDYFVNDHPDFLRMAERQINKLGAAFEDLTVVARDTNFIRLFVSPERLKIEMINDVPSHVGSLVKDSILGIIDSKENILANKLTALIDRTLPKDIVDTYFLLKDGLDIKRALIDAESKAAGIAPLLVAKILFDFDYSTLDTVIKWVEPVDSLTISRFLTAISEKIVRGGL